VSSRRHGELQVLLRWCPGACWRVCVKACLHFCCGGATGGHTLRTWENMSVEHGLSLSRSAGRRQKSALYSKMCHVASGAGWLTSHIRARRMEKAGLTVLCCRAAGRGGDLGWNVSFIYRPGACLWKAWKTPCQLPCLHISRWALPGEKIEAGYSQSDPLFCCFIHSVVSFSISRPVVNSMCVCLCNVCNVCVNVCQ